MLKIRDLAKSLIKVKIGNGESTSLWFDWWTTSASLCNILGYEIIQQQSIQVNAKVAEIIREGQWYLSDLLISNALKEHICNTPILLSSADSPFGFLLIPSNSNQKKSGTL